MRSSRAAYIIGFVCAFAAVISAASPVQAQATQVLLTPATVQIAVGEAVELHVRIENASNLRNVDVLIRYNPRLLEVIDADPEMPGIQVKLGPFLNSREAIVNTVFPAVGEIRFYQTASGPAATGSGDIAVVIFRGLEEGTAFVNIEHAWLYDIHSVEITSITQNARISVGGVPAASPSPTSTASSPLEPTPEPNFSPLPTPNITPPPILVPDTPTPPIKPRRDLRTYQLWPERSQGLISGSLRLTKESLSADQRPILPFGTAASESGEALRAIALLRFPLELLPPGSDILQAMLHVYVDGASRPAKAAFGVYRVLEDWPGGSPERPISMWPALLPKPIALAEIETRFLSGPESDRLQITPLVGVLETPSLQPAQAQLGATTSVSDNITHSLPITLTPIAGQWVNWDVTALARAWRTKQVPNYGLALGPAPHPDADPNTAGNLLVAYAFSKEERATQPYLVLQVEVLPVTPTPVVPVLLPPAGGGNPCREVWIEFLILLSMLTIVGISTWWHLRRSLSRRKDS